MLPWVGLECYCQCFFSFLSYFKRTIWLDAGHTREEKKKTYQDTPMFADVNSACIFSYSIESIRPETASTPICGDQVMGQRPVIVPGGYKNSSEAYFVSSEILYMLLILTYKS